jgi:hypothetical protein
MGREMWEREIEDEVYVMILVLSGRESTHVMLDVARADKSSVSDAVEGRRRKRQAKRSTKHSDGVTTTHYCSAYLVYCPVAS